MARMPQTKSVSVIFLPKSPLIEWMNDDDSELQIRHSKSDPLIHSPKNRCAFYIETSECEENSELNEIDTRLLYPHWLSSSSSSSISSMESTISAEDLIHDMITIEGLRTLYNSCFICGVSWHQNHVTLDCRECGGYAMERPCPECDGKCDSQWRRNLTATHDNHKAIWEGECKLLTSCIQSLSVTELHESSNNSSTHQQLLATLKV